MFRASSRAGLIALVMWWPAIAGAQALDENVSAPNVFAPVAQQPAELTALTYTPITSRERIDWIVDGTIGAKSLGVGVFATMWQTGADTPHEWERWTWSGVTKRYLQREADVAISNSLEAGVGAIWGEEPRYIRSGRKGLWPRTRYAMKTVFLAQRPDGHLAPAWGRVVGNTVNNLIENTWLPPSVTTPGQTIFRSSTGFLGRLAGNLFEEFWPDVVKRMRKRK